MSDSLSDFLVQIARSGQQQTLAGYMSRQEEVDNLKAHLIRKTEYATKLLKALHEVEEIIEERYGGPEDTRNGIILQIIQEAIR